MNVQLSLSASMSSPGSRAEGIPTVKSTESVDSSPSVKDSTKKTEKQQGAPTTTGEEQLIRSIERAVKSLQGPQTTLEISVHEKTHAIMVKVMNKETGDLIREIPSEKILDLVANMMELAGIIVDERV